METPSSTRRVTRSQTLSAIKNSATNHLLSSIVSPEKAEESDKGQRKSRQERSALLDISNESPIVGVAMQTPCSGKRKMSMRRIKLTPGSGEALLRGQVKSLLQMVEEEARVTKISVESRPLIHLVNSPMGLVAPTPANTPQVVDFSQIVISSPVVAGQFRASSVLEQSNTSEEKEESLELEKSPSVTRSLLLDFSDKSEQWESSEDDNSSVWSMQVNASTKDEDEDEDDEDQVCSYTEEEEGVDGLCEGMRKMTFAERHTRFVYDSEGEEIVEANEKSPRVLLLKGLPTPKGKHVRFSADD